MQPAAETGERLDQRYRLDRRVDANSPTALWQATDEILERQVAVRLVGDRTRSQAKDITAAVTRAGRVPDARWVRVLDVGDAAVDKRLTVWVVSEWVEGETLTNLLRQDSLRGPAATTLILSCAQAVVAAHRENAHHGGLHPDEVIITAEGSPRLTGLEISAVLRAAASPMPAYDDVRGLGALLYACLTGRWPLAGWNGLPNPSRGDGVHPRQQRGGVSRELDEITARALTGGYADASSFARDLATLPMAPLHPEPPDPEDRARRGELWRRWAWRIVPPLLVAGIGAGAWLVGSDLGRIPSPARAAAPSFPQPHQHGTKTKGQVVWSKPPHITSFDPEGDGAEDPGGVGLAVDDDPSTEWVTDIYHDNPRFGGLKKGVGLLLDLRHPKLVDTAALLLSAPGADIQLRAGNVAPTQATDLPIVASRLNTPAAVRLALTTPVKARYWLLWITSLPPSGPDYRLGVAEIALQR